MDLNRQEEWRLALQKLVKGFGHGGISRVAAALDKDPSYVGRLLYPPDKPHRKGIGYETAELLDLKFPGWRDTDAQHPAPPVVKEMTSDYGNPWPFQKFTLAEFMSLPPAARADLEVQISAVIRAHVTTSRRRKAA